MEKLILIFLVANIITILTLLVLTIIIAKELNINLSVKGAIMQDNLIYKKSIDTFGKQMQIIVAIEEMSELQQAISKDIRCKEHNVEEEIADVEIMIEQLKIIYDVEKVNKIKAEKLIRLQNTLLKLEGEL